MAVMISSFIVILFGFIIDLERGRMSFTEFFFTELFFSRPFPAVTEFLYRVMDFQNIFWDFFFAAFTEFYRVFFF